MKTKRMRSVLSKTAVLFALAATASVPAWAQGEPEAPTAEEPPPGEGDDARRFFNAAQKAFAEGRYTEAAHGFEKAFALKPHPAPLINAGDAWDKAGEYALAARAFQQVLEMKIATEQDRIDATDRLSRIAPKLGIIELVGNKKLRARVDKEEFQGGDRVYLFPGEHVVTLVDVDGSSSRKIDLAPGTERSVDLSTLFPKKDTTGPGTTPGGGDPTMDGPAEGEGIRPLTYVALGVGGVGLLAAGIFGLQVNSAESSYNSNPNQGDLDSFKQAKLLSNVSLGIGFVGAVVGTVFLLQDLGKSKLGTAQAPTPRRRGITDVGMVSTPGGGMLLTTGRF